MRAKTVRFSTFMFCLLWLAAVATSCGSYGASITSATPATMPLAATSVPSIATSSPATATSFPPTATSAPAGAAPAPVTLADNGTTITVQAGQRFLLNLGSEYNWDVQVADPSIVSRVVNITVIRGAQGVYEAHAAGETKLTATGIPNCDSTQAGCSQIAQQFEVKIVVPAAGAVLPPTSGPTASITAVPTIPGPAYPPYLDDRSDAAAVINSLFNAINLHQDVRAYSYWDDTPQRASFDQFKAGYQDTASVQVILGSIGEDAGAGNLYASAPVTLIAKTNAGATQTFVGCYVLHLSQPGIQGTLPFRPWGIQSATMTRVDNNANTSDLMSHACAISGQPIPPTPIADPNDVSASRYIDNRTGPIELLQSLFNALNRHEYVRAYSYWQSAAPDLPGLDQFTQGYSATQLVTPTFGLVTPDAGAGQIRYMVPTTLKTANSDGSQQTFVGCYFLNIGNPDLQTQPPFQPLAIKSANVKQVANDVDTGSLMNQMCGMP